MDTRIPESERAPFSHTQTHTHSNMNCSHFANAIKTNAIVEDVDDNDDGGGYDDDDDDDVLMT